MKENHQWHSHLHEVNGTQLCLYSQQAQLETNTAPTAATTRPIILMLHGMRDVAASLRPIANALSSNFRPVLMDLRGHGASGQPGAYAMEHFLFDLHQIAELLSPNSPLLLFGHSLGGQIVARFSGLWPKRVRAAVVVEGLGPPALPSGSSEAAEIQRYASRILDAYTIPAAQRPLPSVKFAAERLSKNNPRLDPDQANKLAAAATTTNADGDLVWAFDPRVRTVFAGVSETVGATQWRQTQAPVLIVGGALAHQYWRQSIPPHPPEDESQTEGGWSGRYQPGEYEARAANFADHEFILFPDAGHMVHYDTPEQLAQVTLNFLERRA